MSDVPPEGVYLVVGTAITALFTFLGIIAKGVFSTRSMAGDARNEASKAMESITTIEENTDGFPQRVDSRLSAILNSTARLESRLANVEHIVGSHLTWHIERKK